MNIQWTQPIRTTGADTGWATCEPFGKRHYYVNGHAVPSWYGRVVMWWLKK